MLLMFLVYIVAFLLPKKAYNLSARIPFDDEAPILQFGPSQPWKWNERSLILQGDTMPPTPRQIPIQRNDIPDSIPAKGTLWTGENGVWIIRGSEQNTPDQSKGTSLSLRQPQSEQKRNSDPLYLSQITLTFQLLARVNGERTSRGLKPLCANKYTFALMT
ncbi:hypothetical protein DI09_187p20 [Mitosporidium daphniae]|uniref:Uncharacterized protein n=1 Tax=Mitosporidium daphniae TaxID=1485682 RepID=A0A098VQ41_9MICR|nr:uncharacterized protein DI09_44p140 [Mitosporidium daphniae]XP_013238775.1 uncharacterized protein DI09_187p20 [Mitosporidium daphniae]KGG51110.1 hypothetical protein DI09_44p140 [Mitosporidium daphniae]KGG52339.1 hypothetical protein DI09_187p20 [Mitosporidium daphniae]|eukprot:XP_013237537.1 uncharacterized protein DI09_44p140 [Mitosporidium daphniae]